MKNITRAEWDKLTLAEKRDWNLPAYMAIGTDAEFESLDVHRRWVDDDIATDGDLDMFLDYPVRVKVSPVVRYMLRGPNGRLLSSHWWPTSESARDAANSSCLKDYTIVKLIEETT